MAGAFALARQQEFHAANPRYTLETGVLSCKQFPVPNTSNAEAKMPASNAARKIASALESALVSALVLINVLLPAAALAGVTSDVASDTVADVVLDTDSESASDSAPARAMEHPTDEEIASLIEVAGTSEDHAGADVVVVFDRTDVEVEDSGLSHVVNHVVTKVLTDEGARDRAMVRFDYDPATQASQLRGVRVHRQIGTVESVDLTGLIDVTAPAHAIYWGGRMQVLGLPRLEVGDAVEIETYRKGFQIAYLNEDTGSATESDDSKYIPPMEGHFYDVILFQTTVPILEKTYTLRTPRDKPVQYSVYNGEIFSAASFDDAFFTYKFWKTDVPAAKREWRSPGLSDYAPKVVLATVQDWYEKSRWFWEANQDQFADNADIRQMVAEITRGLKTDEEKIAAINHWVAQEIRYCGLNMGEGEGYTLHPGEMIFNERSGVCKDIAGMAITMLRSAGYEVYPAMTMAGARVERIPADQFNHCVVALRKADGTYEMLDPTWIPFAMNNWSRAEGEQHYVIGSPAGEDLTATPTYTPEDNLVTLDLQGKVSEDGTLTGTLKLIADGYADTRLRRSLGFVPRDRQRPSLERWLANLAPGAELLKYEFGDHHDFARPLPLKLEFSIPGYASVGRTRITMQPCATRLVMGNYGGLFRFAASDLPAERTNPALIWYPQKVVLTETIEWPSDYRAEQVVGDWQCGEDGDIAACTLTSEPAKRKLKITGTFRVDKRTILPTEWPEFQAAVSLLEDFGGAQLVAKRKGA